VACFQVAISAPSQHKYRQKIKFYNVVFGLSLNRHLKQTAVVCCMIFSELKNTTQSLSAKFGLSRKANFHAKQIFTQRLISGFDFTTNFPENLFSTQSLSTKFGSVFNYHAKFSDNNFNKFLSEK